MARVLIAGGYGVVGSWIARELRAAHNDIDLVIAGRNRENGSALADELGCEIARIDVDNPADDLAALGPLDLVVASLRDPGDNLAMAAMKGGAAFTSIAQRSETISALAIAASLAGRPALVQSYWMAGAVTLGVLAEFGAFGGLDRIEVSALYDYGDPIGPMTAADSGEFSGGALIRQAGSWLRVDSAAHARTVTRGERPPFEARPISVLDRPGLAAATGAAEIRFDLGFGKSAGALAGGHASHDVFIDLWGSDRSGRPLTRRVVMSDPKGQAHFTALGVLVGTERILGLDGRPALGDGIHFPEDSIEPAQAMRRLRDFGVSITAGPA